MKDIITLIKFTINKNNSTIDVSVFNNQLETYLQSNEKKLQPYFDRLKYDIPEKLSNKNIIITFNIYDLKAGKPNCKTIIDYPRSLRKYIKSDSESIVNSLNETLSNIFMVAVNANDARQIQ